jgi:hypothetical protein
MTTTQSPLSAVRAIDAYAGSFDVTNTLVVTVHAEPQTVREALERLDLAASAARSLDALGVGERVALAPSLLAAAAGPELVFGLIWRLAGPATTIDPRSVAACEVPGHVKVIWDLRLQPDALDGALLSATRRFTATDAAARARLLAAWGIIGSVADSLSRRMLTAVKRCAEDRDEDFDHAPSPVSTGLLPAPLQNERGAALIAGAR